MAQLQSTSITGSLIVTQGITAQSLNVQYITSSIVYSSGSNTFGDTTSDNQYFTGSILQSGSLALFAGSVGIGTTNPSGRLTVSTPNSYDGTILQLQSRDDPATYNLKVDEVVTSGVVRWSFGMTNSSAYSNVLVFDRGNVGIGVTTPGNLLTVGGSMRLVTGTLDGLFAYDAASGGAYIWSLTRYTDTSANDLNINTRSGFGIRTNVTSLTNSGHQFYITSGGNVGIGTVVPTAKLHVTGSADVLLVEGSGSTSNTSLFAIDGNNGRLFEVSDDLSDSLFSVNTIAGLPVIEAFADNTVIMGAYNKSDLVITGSSVGIGTPSPVRKLDVYDSGSQIVAQFSSSNATSTRIKFSDANTGAENVNVGAIGTRLALWTNNTERLSILSGGSVGIGITNPANRLDVLGTVSASAFLGSVTNATSASFATSASYANNAGNAATANFATTAGSATTATSASFASTAPYSGLTGTVPTWNQNTTGNAATATSASFATSASNARSAITASSADTFFVRGSIGVGTTTPGAKIQVDTGGSNSDGEGIRINRPVAGNNYHSLEFATNNTVDWSIGQNVNDSFEIYENGSAATTRFSIREGGSVGIGTTAPGYRLEVQGTGYFNSTLIANDDFGLGRTPASNEQIAISVPLNQYAIAFYSGSSLNYGMHTNQGVFNFQAISGSAWNFQSGNVGIGTTSPTVPLHVIGNILVTGASSVFSGGALEIQGTANAVKTFYLNRYGVANGSQHRLRAENAYFEIASANSEAIVLTGGNVGIGSTAPAYFLDVKAGSTSNVSRIYGTGTAQVSYFGSTAQSQYSDIALVADNGQGEVWRSGTGYTSYGGASALNIWNSNGPIAFHPNNTSNVLFLTTGGNVGIGVTTPSQKLEVTGNIYATGYVQGATAYISDQSGVSSFGSNSGTRSIRVGRDGTANDIFITGSSGNVGIGISTPVHKLAVLGTVSASAYLGSVTSAVSASFAPNFANTNLTLNGNRTHDLGGNTLTFTATSDEAVVFNHSSGGSFEINGSPTIQTTGTLQHRGGAYFSGSGTNVGIGTTNPGYRLDVRGESYINNGANTGLHIDTTVADNTTRDAIYLYEDDGQATGRQAISWYNGNSGGGSYYKARLWTQVGSSYTATVFGIDVANDAQQVATRLAIRNGNVGIGIDTPSATLHVSGDVKATLASSGQPNFVAYNTSTGLLTYASTGSIGVGTATNADNVYVTRTDSDINYSLVLAQPPHDEYEALVADANNASYNPSTGTLTVVTLNASEKSFVIPHQGLPGKKLVYGVLEGPEHSVYVRGRSKERIIYLPEEWEWLVDSESITVSLTPVGKYCDLYVEQIESTSIIVNSTVDSIEYFYHVYATRKDVEPLKTVQ